MSSEKLRYGEIVVPEGEYLTLTTPIEILRLGSGTSLEFVEMQHLTASELQKYGDEIILVTAGSGDASLPTLFVEINPETLDRDVFDPPSEWPILGAIPIHWISSNKPVRQYDSDECFGDSVAQLG